jgi:hypothetical protein
MSARHSKSHRRAARASNARKPTPAADVERLDATPERIARAAENGQEIAYGPDRRRRIDDPFDVMRAHRALAPHDRKLNDLRWLIGEALRRLHHRAALDGLRAVAPDRISAGVGGPRSGLPLSEAALHARDKLRAAERLAGAAVWPVLRRVVIEGAMLRDCRVMIVEVTTSSTLRGTAVDKISMLSMIYGRTTLANLPVDFPGLILQPILLFAASLDIAEPGRL